MQDREVRVRVVYPGTKDPTAHEQPVFEEYPIDDAWWAIAPEGYLVLYANADRGDLNGQVLEERAAQHAQWGEQNPPNATPFHANHFPTAERARDACEAAFDARRGSWAHILVEEVGEALDEARDGNVDKLEAELVQVEAVVRAWREAIRRAR